jgi:hypothetical protein
LDRERKDMNSALKRFFLITAKSAITAVIAAAGPVVQDPDHYNLTSAHGWGHVGILLGTAVLGRELAVWIPKVLNWADSPTK